MSHINIISKLSLISRNFGPFSELFHYGEYFIWHLSMNEYEIILFIILKYCHLKISNKKLKLQYKYYSFNLYSYLYIIRWSRREYRHYRHAGLYLIFDFPP